MKHYLFIFILLLSLFKESFAQNTKIDSLVNKLQTTKEDTTQVKTLNEIAQHHFNLADYNKSLFFLERAKKIASGFLNLSSKQSQIKINSLKNEMAASFILEGRVFTIQGNYDKALEKSIKALKINRETQNKRREAEILKTMGNIFKSQGDYSKAMDHYLNALKISELLGDRRGVASSYNSIGIIYKFQKKYESALLYYQKSLNIYTEIGEKKGIATAYNNIGNVYAGQGNHEKALENHFKALKMHEIIGHPVSIANTYNNIGSNYSEQGDVALTKGEASMAEDKYQKSLSPSLTALKIYEKIGDRHGVAMATNNVGKIYGSLKKYSESETWLNKGLALSKEIKDKYEMKNSFQYLAEMYNASGNFRKAYQYQNLYIQKKDSLLNSDNFEAMANLKANYEFGKKEQELKLIAKAKESEQKVALEKQKVIIYSLASGGILVLLLASVAVKGYRQKQKANIELDVKNQKITQAYEIIEFKNKEITDSITYAKRIQGAILPSNHLIGNYFNDFFVLYKPKDIVAGDFYWMEVLTNHNTSESTPKTELILLASADCTGHGVPGAMVSVVCANALNKAVKEFGLVEPGRILDKTTELVLETFEKSEIKDGMDISLCCINTSTLELQWAGAHSPFRYITNNQLKEIKADKQPVGMYENRKPFTTHNIQLNKGDCFYLFSDGFADQFGGPEGKKFMSKRFKETLSAIQNLKMPEQEKTLDKTFEEWKGKQEQVDDVLVMGVRV